VEADPERFLRAYAADARSFAGRYICSDLFKEQFEHYRNAPTEVRGRYVAPVHNASAVLAAEQFRRVIMENSDPKRDTVIFLTGIPGAGKTSSVLSNNRLPLECHAVYEGQLSRPEPAIEKIQQTLDAGLKPCIVAVHPRPENALANTFKRFEKCGRGASIEVMADIQGGLPEGLAKIHQHFGDIVALEIKDYRDRAHPRELAGWENLNILRSEGNHEQIKRRLEAELERQRPNISEAAYDHAKGRQQGNPRVVGQLGHELQADDRGRGIPERDRKADILKQAERYFQDRLPAASRQAALELVRQRLQEKEVKKQTPEKGKPKPDLEPDRER
jgi:hypothetical protein